MTALHHWPSELPPLPSGYDESLPNTRIEFVPDIGPAKTRPKVSDAGETVMRLPFEMTGAQVDVLREFYNVTTSGGLEALGFPHPQQGRASSMYDIGTWVEARLVAVDISHISGDQWLATCEFRVVV